MSSSLSWQFRLLRLDRREGNMVLLLALVWLIGAMNVYLNNFAVEPDAGRVIGKEDTVSGSFAPVDGWLLHLSPTVMFFGWIFGALLFPIVSDRFGRRTGFIAGILVLLCGDLLAMLSWSMLAFLAGRCITGMGIGACGVISYCWASEFCLSYKRYSISGGDVDFPAIVMRTGIAFQIMWSCGGCLLPLVAYMFPYWRHLILMIMCIVFIVGVAVLVVVPESPEWIIAQSQYQPLTIADVDNEKPAVNVDINNNNNKKPNNFMLIFKRKTFLLLLAFAVVWFSIALIFYGLSLNTHSLPGNVYLVTAAVNFSSIPGLILSISMERRFGMKTVFVSSLFLSSIVFVGMSAMTVFQLHVGTIIMSLFAQLLSSLQFSLLYMTTTGAFETEVRATSLGICVTVARLGAMTSSVVTGIGKNGDGTLGYPALGIMSALALLAAMISYQVVQVPSSSPLKSTITDVDVEDEDPHDM